MKNLKIAIIGNSVGLRSRPPEKYPNNKNYGIILEELLQDKFPNECVWVRNFCIGRATIWDILERRNEILNLFPHYYIINLGVTDASTREIPLWFSNIITSNRVSFWKRVLEAFYFYTIKKFRPFFVNLKFRTSWTSKRNFRYYFNRLIALLNKDTNARIIILSINPASLRIEEILPGSMKKYLEFNAIIEEIANKYNAYYIDTSKVIEDRHIPDGIHFSLEGNKLIAQTLSDLIINEENSKN